MSRLQLVPGSDSEEEVGDGDCGRKVKPEKGRANEITMAKKLDKDFLCWKSKTRMLMSDFECQCLDYERKKSLTGSFDNVQCWK